MRNIGTMAADSSLSQALPVLAIFTANRKSEQAALIGGTVKTSASVLVYGPSIIKSFADYDPAI
jgi:phage terminase large subunit-like protein